MKRRPLAIANSPETRALVSTSNPNTNMRELPLEINRRTAHIKLIGPIFDVLEYAALTSMISSLETNEEVDNITLLIDSPGGLINGVYETAKAINKCSKPINTLVTGDCCSAAYWIASATNRINAYPTAVIGSIGVLVYPEPSNPDESTLVSKQSPNKHLNSSSEESTAMLQAIIDGQADVMISEIARFRGVTAEVVESQYGSGSIFIASEALNRGLIDEVTTGDNMDELNAKIEELMKQLEEKDSLVKELEDKLSGSKSEGVSEDVEETEDKEESESVTINVDAIAEDEPTDSVKEEVVVEESKSEDKPSDDRELKIKELMAQLEELKASAYSAQREAAVEKLMSAGAIRPCDKSLAVATYDGEQRGDHKLFTAYFTKPNSAFQTTRQSHAASIEHKAETGKTTEQSVHDSVIAACKSMGLNWLNPSHYETALKSVRKI